MIQGALIVLSFACAVAAIALKDLLSSAIALAGFGLVISLLFYVLHAPDVALTEAAVGAGVSTVIFVLTINRIRKRQGDDES